MGRHTEASHHREIFTGARTLLKVALHQDRPKIAPWVGLISVLHHAGSPAGGPVAHDAKRHQRPSDPEVDAAFLDLIGEDAAALRKPASDVVALLQLLTLSSVHPLMSTGRLDAADIVDVVLDGTRKKA